MNALSKLQNEIDRVFDCFPQFDFDILTYGDAPSYVCVKGDYPKANVETYLDDGRQCALIEMAVPGLTKEFIEVSLSGGVLSIKGSKCNKVERQEKNVKLNELHKSSFYREFNLNNLFEVDEDDVDVSLNNGVLSVVVKAAKESKPKRKLLEVK